MEINSILKFFTYFIDPKEVMTQISVVAFFVVQRLGDTKIPALLSRDFYQEEAATVSAAFLRCLFSTMRGSLVVILSAVMIHFEILSF